MSQGTSAATPSPMAAAKAPVAAAPVATIGVVVAVLLTALGVVAVRDALVAGSAITGTPWLIGALEALDGLTPALWFLVVAAVLLLFGIWLVSRALRPRPRSGVALHAETGVFLRPQDVARLASGAASKVDGVLASKASASTKKLVVQVTTTGDQGTEGQVRDAVTARLSHLDGGPGIRVKAHAKGQAASTPAEGGER